MSSGIHALLKGSIPSRFMNVTPHHFEEFICQLFKDAGYHAELTQQSSDFGADIILTKGDKKVAVQVKRYEQGRKVGVKEVNQTIGARDFYGCDRALVITTSEFTQPAIKLAARTQTELWDWEKLYEKIKEVYLEGKDVYEYFSEKEVDMLRESGSGREAKSKDCVIQDEFEFRVERIEENQLMQDQTTATILQVGMKNLSNKKINVTVYLPILIDSLGNQFSSYIWLSGGFQYGDIYPYASVPIIACWHAWQVPKASAIDRVIVRYQKSEDGEIREVAINVPESLKEVKGIVTESQRRTETSGCFIVTFCFGRESSEYREMVSFRNEVLSQSFWGRVLIYSYYKVSPWLITLAVRSKILTFIFKKGVFLALWCVRTFGRKQ